MAHVLGVLQSEESTNLLNVHPWLVQYGYQPYESHTAVRIPHQWNNGSITEM